MLLVGGPVDLLGLRVQVALEDLLDVRRAEALPSARGELDGVALGDVEVGGQRDRDRPDTRRPRAVIFSTTLFQSSEPMGPVSGAKPPLPIISKSAVWRVGELS